MKQNRTLGLLLAVSIALVAIALAGSARAATIAITPVYVQSYSDGLIPLGTLPDGGATTPVGGLLLYEFRLSLDDLQAGEDFWTAIFDVNLGPGLEAVTSWMAPGIAQANGFYPAGPPSLATYDSNGAAFGGVEQHWQFGNEDFGVDPSDLKSIIVEAAPDEAANRQYGELVRPGAGSADGLGSPTLIGAVLVRRIELVDTGVSVTPIAGNPWGIYQNNAGGSGLLVPQSGSSFTSVETRLAVPEPGTSVLAILGLAALAMLGRRRPA